MTESTRTWSSRRLGAENSSTRAALIDAAERLLIAEGYAAVTSRRVAAEAGLKPQLIHYYFRSMDDLFLDMFRRGAERSLKRLRTALDSEQPLRALWDFIKDPRGTAFTTEFTALANHNEVIRQEIARYAEQFREVQTEALARHLAARGVTPRIPLVVASVLLVSVSTVLVREAALGMSMGHAETEALVETCLRQFEEMGEVPSSPILMSGS